MRGKKSNTNKRKSIYDILPIIFILVRRMVIISIDNHLDEKYIIYSSFDLDLDFKQEEMLKVYQKHNKNVIRNDNELL